VAGPIPVRADDGVDLSLYRVTGERRNGLAPVLLVHGTFSNRTYFLGTRGRALAFSLAQRGFDIWVAELRGHGRSGERGRASAWHFEDWIRRDAPALVRGVLEGSGNGRLAWLGHSAGGAIGAAFTATGGALCRHIAALVLAATPAPTGLGPIQYPMTALVVAISRILGRFPARALGIGPEDEHGGILTQWLGWNLKGAWIGEDGTDYFGACRDVRLPVLAIAGAGDWLMAPARNCKDMLDQMGGTDKTFVVCGRAQGFSADYNHEDILVRSAAQRELWPLIGDWLESRLG
jgi:oxygen-independent coproporphyrinogen-3 oxidase